MAASRDEIRAFVQRRIAEIARERGAPVDLPGDDFNLVESGMFDSLSFVNLVGAIEREFSLEIDFGDLDPEDLMTVGGLVASAARAQPA